MSRRKGDLIRDRTMLALAALLFIQGMANAFLYSVVLYRQYQFGQIIEALAGLLNAVTGAGMGM